MFLSNYHIHSNIPYSLIKILIMFPILNSRSYNFSSNFFLVLTCLKGLQRKYELYGRISYIYTFWYNFDTVLCQFLETGTSDRCLIGIVQLLRFSGFSQYTLHYTFLLYSPFNVRIIDCCSNSCTVLITCFPFLYLYVLIIISGFTNYVPSSLIFVPNS